MWQVFSDKKRLNSTNDVAVCIIKGLPLQRFIIPLKRTESISGYFFNLRPLRTVTFQTLLFFSMIFPILDSDKLPILKEVSLFRVFYFSCKSSLHANRANYPQSICLCGSSPSRLSVRHDTADSSNLQ
jgi:hypothetical protein